MFRVLYHAPCPDGAAAAFVASLYLERTGVDPFDHDRVSWHPMKVFLPPEEQFQTSKVGRDDEVILVDYSATVDFTCSIAARARCVTVLDHHLSAITAFAAAKASGSLPANLHTELDVKRSGATVALDYFAKRLHEERRASLAFGLSAWPEALVPKPTCTALCPSRMEEQEANKSHTEAAAPQAQVQLEAGAQPSVPAEASCCCRVGATACFCFLQAAAESAQPPPSPAMEAEPGSLAARVSAEALSALAAVAMGQDTAPAPEQEASPASETPDSPEASPPPPPQQHHEPRPMPQGGSKAAKRRRRKAEREASRGGHGGAGAAPAWQQQAKAIPPPLPPKAALAAKLAAAAALPAGGRRPDSGSGAQGAAAATGAAAIVAPTATGAQDTSTADPSGGVFGGYEALLGSGHAGEALLRLLRLFEDSDLYRWWLQDSREFSAGFANLRLNYDVRVNPGLFKTLRALDVPAVSSTGKAVLQSETSRLEKEMAYTFVVSIPQVNRRCLGVRTTSPELRSALGHAVAERSRQQGLWGVGLVVYTTADLERKGLLKVSARSVEGEDTLAFTEKFGGGGHRAASSCTVMKFIFESWCEDEEDG